MLDQDKGLERDKADEVTDFLTSVAVVSNQADAERLREWQKPLEWFQTAHAVRCPDPRTAR